MNTETLIDNAKGFIKELFINNADGHDYMHSIRVYENAKMIAEHYSECDKEIIELAALLHDVDDYKLFETKDNENARNFLNSQGLEKNKIDKICNVINCVSFSKNKDRILQSIEEMIVQDADRLDALGAIGIARTFAYGGKHGRSIEESIKHFYDKLFLLKEKMNTSVGKQIAEDRHRVLENFIEEYKKETNN